jgi:excisionase family DNA binding protein
MGKVIQLDLWGHKDLVLDAVPAFKLPKRDNLVVEEVAAYLRVSDRTVLRWIDDGSLVASKRGQSIWISKNALRRFLRASRTDHVTPEEFNARRAAIAVVKQAIRQSLPVEMPDDEKRKTASNIYNKIKNELRTVGDAL